MSTRKLIEVALPLDDINAASVREKSIRYGHPSTLHLWWSRKPLATTRAVLFASLVDDPDQEGVPVELLAKIDRLPAPEMPDWQELPLGEQRRQRLFRFIRLLVKWESTNDERVFTTARDLIHAATSGNPPPVYDPFAGGGSIPLEAQRLGLEANASDLNPVAVLLNKALIELPPKYAGMPPVNPVDRNQIGAEWKGPKGLSADVRYYGKWMRDEAEKRIGHLYPKVKLPKEYGGGEATAIAWLWARTVTCPNPVCGALIPLTSKFLLSKKAGQELWAEPVIDSRTKTIRFRVNADGSSIPEPPKIGRGAKFRCLVCGQIAEEQHIKSEAKDGRMGAELMAVVAEGKRSRVYLSPSDEHIQIANNARPEWLPTQPLADDPRNIWCVGYGLDTFDKLFTSRQLVALSTFCDLIKEAHRAISEQVRGIPDREVKPYADAVSTYLALAVSRLSDRNSSLCTWDSGPTGTKSSTGGSAKTSSVRGVFTRQALPMSWDFAEASPLAEASGGFLSALEWVIPAVAALPATGRGEAVQKDVAELNEDGLSYLLSTDPPYYDNVSYAGLSDFFYVWLRKALYEIYPDIFSTLLVPKSQELVADPYRFGGNKKQAEEFFEYSLKQGFRNMRQAQNQQYPLTVYYAFKQAESDGQREAGMQSIASTGWETMLEGLVNSGFTINGTWPMRTELANRSVGIGTNALASSIVLVCRPRPEDARSTTRLEFIRALRRELPRALRALQRANIAPVDLAQAAIGPGMAIYSRYKAVLEADGSPMRVRTALQLINAALDEVLAEQEGEYDADTRWAIAWFEQSAFDEGQYGVAETLSKAKNTSVAGMVEAGVVVARGGKVRLLARDELPSNWNPAKDTRVTAWEATQHLVRALDKGGESGAAVILAALPGAIADQARDLAYRLYTTCERKKWAQEALAYNSLVIAWPEIAKLAVLRADDGGPMQARMEL